MTGIWIIWNGLDINGESEYTQSICYSFEGLYMSIIVPSTSIVQFWFNKKINQSINGTPKFIEESLNILLRNKRILSEGVEIFLMPSRLSPFSDFSIKFYKIFHKFKYKTVHIHERKDILLSDGYEYKLSILNNILNKLNVNKIIIHAHFFQKDRFKKKYILNSLLERKTIIIENNGFDNEWGSEINNLTSIFKDCPEFQFCLDLAHIKDFNKYSLSDFYNNHVLYSRLKEIHFSYSTRFCKDDPYEKKGFKGYGPYHALFSILKKSPSTKTKKFITKYPLVLEGVVPKEDMNLDYLIKEMELLK